MKALFKAINMHLQSGTLYTALSGSIYNDEAPQGTALPYAAFSMVSGTPSYNFVETFESIVVQFDIYAATEAQILSLYENLLTDFDDADFAVIGYQLIRCQRSFQQKLRKDNFKRYIVQYDIFLEKE